MACVPSVCPSLSFRLLSAVVARYPLERGKTWLRGRSGRWLVAQLRFGPWVRVSGLVNAEWEYLSGHDKEPSTTAFLKACIKPGMTFVDVGANVGYFSLLAASLGARVIAYEPTPKVFQRFRENVELNRFREVTLVNAAVAEKAGWLRFHECSEDPEANSIFGEGEGIEVAAVKLDDDLATRGVREVNVLKVDAEGAEPLVLQGARNLLQSSHRPLVIIEVNSYCLTSAGSSVTSLLAMLEEFGYGCVEIESGWYKDGPVANVLALPSKKALAVGQMLTASATAA